jgi:hypothetical protein
VVLVTGSVLQLLQEEVPLPKQVAQAELQLRHCQSDALP